MLHSYAKVIKIAQTKMYGTFFLSWLEIKVSYIVKVAADYLIRRNNNL